VQTRAYDRADFSKNWPSVLERVERACREGAKLVVLPEGTVPGYVIGDDPIDENELGMAAKDIGRLARAHGATIVYGGVKIVRGRTYNAAIVVGPGGDELGFAAKQFLWHFDRRWFVAGETLAPIDTPVGKLGVLVCADGRIPTIAATLVERGADLLVMPTAWVTSGRDPSTLENVQADLMANVRARENGVPFIVANKCGVEVESVAYCGKSAIIDASGAFVARAGERDEANVAGTIAVRGQASVPPPPPSVVEPEATREEPVRSRARIAFAFARAGEIARFGRLAAQGDADVFVTFGEADDRDGDRAGLIRIALGESTPLDLVRDVAGLRYALVSPPALRAPRGLVPARLAGVDLFICRTDGDPDWSVRVARTRAAELRAYVLCFDVERERAFAVDPDGVVVGGTFGDFRLGAFAYDASRAHATMVAPRTDVLEGLRIAERLRGERATVRA
jgi:predicted amidohydrolase